MKARKFKTLWHIGDFDEKDRKESSHEGQLLSVSPNQEVSRSWREIARLGGAPTWKLKKPDGEPFRMLDSQTKIGDWGVGTYVEKTTYWKVSWDDDEGEERYFLFEHKKEADMEMDGLEDLNGEIGEEPGWKPLPPLQKFWRGKIDPLMVDDARLVAYAHEHGYDGVFWNDTHEPESLSAPRGGIFQTPQKLSRELA